MAFPIGPEIGQMFEKYKWNGEFWEENYKEGTFKVYLNTLNNDAVVTYGVRNDGRYTRVGNLVFYWIDLYIDDIPDRGTGRALINLPFPVYDNNTDSMGHGVVYFRYPSLINSNLRPYSQHSYHISSGQGIVLAWSDGSGNIDSLDLNDTGSINSNGRLTTGSFYFTNPTT